MTWHIVCLAGPTDRYAPTLVSGDSLLRVPFDTPEDADAPRKSWLNPLLPPTWL